MELNQIKKILITASTELYQHQKHLIDERANERTISAHLLGYLRPLLKEWDVDTDYNREAADRRAKRDIDGKIAYPDIIIHKYGPEGPNLAAIEIKGYWNKTSRQEDETKLRKLQAKHLYLFLFRIELKVEGPEIIEVKDTL